MSALETLHIEEILEIGVGVVEYELKSVRMLADGALSIVTNPIDGTRALVGNAYDTLMQPVWDAEAHTKLVLANAISFTIAVMLASSMSSVFGFPEDRFGPSEDFFN